MNSSVVFSPLQEADLPNVVDLYNHYVLNTTSTFHELPFMMESIRELVFFESSVYQTFVINENECFCGYVLLTQHKKREAYDRTAEVTIYLRPDWIGKGLGSKAVMFIEDYARERGIHALVATICGENEKSINLFARNGYSKCAHYREVGRKFGQWLDVVAYEKIISGT